MPAIGPFARIAGPFPKRAKIDTYYIESKARLAREGQEVETDRKRLRELSNVMLDPEPEPVVDFEDVAVIEGSKSTEPESTIEPETEPATDNFTSGWGDFVGKKGEKKDNKKSKNGTLESLLESEASSDARWDIYLEQRKKVRDESNHPRENIPGPEVLATGWDSRTAGNKRSWMDWDGSKESDQEWLSSVSWNEGEARAEPSVLGAHYTGFRQAQARPQSVDICKETSQVIDSEEAQVARSKFLPDDEDGLMFSNSFQRSPATGPLWQMDVSWRTLMPSSRTPSTRQLPNIQIAQLNQH